jgi:transposase InsO family protein
LREHISDRFEYLLGEADKRAYRLKGSNDPIIDSGATSTCSGKIDLFESLDQRYGGSLGTAGRSIEIAGGGTMRIPLSSGKVARIRNALYEQLMTCETCIQAKSVKRQSHAEVPRASRPVKRVYMDFWGPYTKAKTLERYYLSLTDDCTRFSWIYLTEDREAATVKAILEQWLALAEREKGVKLLIIRTDNAREFKALGPWALKKGIQIKFTEPDTPQQNGVAERLNRYLLEMTRRFLSMQMFQRSTGRTRSRWPIISEIEQSGCEAPRKPLLRCGRDIPQICQSSEFRSQESGSIGRQTISWNQELLKEYLLDMSRARIII